MPWFRVDDKFGEHPKVRAIPRSRRRNAIGLWLLAGSWCALNYKQNGNVPGFMVEELCADLEDALELARVGLWHAAGHDCDCDQPRDVDGFVFHHWADLQPTAEKVDAKREADAERQRAHRERKKAERDAASRHESVTRDDTVSHGPVRSSRPDPTRPDPSRPSESELGGNRYVTSAPLGVTMRPEDARCTNHADVLGDPGPCRGCMKAREAFERTEKQAAADRAAAARDCRRCGGHLWLEFEDGSPAQKCDHRPILEVVGE